MLNGIEGMSLKVLGCLGWSAKQTKGFLLDVKRDIADPKVTAYVAMSVSCDGRGGRPFANEI